MSQVKLDHLRSDMVVVECTAGCGWKSAARSEAFAAVLAAELANHTSVAHTMPASQHASQQPRIRLDPPKVATGTSAEDWERQLEEALVQALQFQALDHA